MAVLYINGTILTMKQKETAQALLEEDGRILCVGTQAQCRQYAQGLDSLTIRDLKGQTLMPGLWIWSRWKPRTAFPGCRNCLPRRSGSVKQKQDSGFRALAMTIIF